MIAVVICLVALAASVVFLTWDTLRLRADMMRTRAALASLVGAVEKLHVLTDRKADRRRKRAEASPPPPKSVTP